MTEGMPMSVRRAGGSVGQLFRLGGLSWILDVSRLLMEDWTLDAL